jgi:hypothetical protein
LIITLFFRKAQTFSPKIVIISLTPGYCSLSRKKSHVTVKSEAIAWVIPVNRVLDKKRMIGKIEPRRRRGTRVHYPPPPQKTPTFLPKIAENSDPNIDPR